MYHKIRNLRDAIATISPGGSAASWRSPYSRCSSPFAWAACSRHRSRCSASWCRSSRGCSWSWCGTTSRGVNGRDYAGAGTDPRRSSSQAVPAPRAPRQARDGVCAAFVVRWALEQPAVGSRQSRLSQEYPMEGCRSEPVVPPLRHYPVVALAPARPGMARSQRRLGWPG